MDENELINDPFLRNLFKKSPLESPSGDFTERIMRKIQPVPELVTAKKPFFSFIKSFLGYLLLIAVIIGFFWTSDIPVLSWLPGKQFLSDSVLPSFSILVTWFKSFFGSISGISIPLMILIASGLFFLADKFLIQRKFFRNQPSA